MARISHRWRLALISALVLGSLSTPVQAHTPVPPDTHPASDSAPPSSALTGELFYELLVGEISAAQGDYVNAIALLLEAARETEEEALFQRAAEVALQSRSGPRALSVAQEWHQNFPVSQEANRFLLHVLLLLNRVSESQEPLAREVASTPINSKPAAYLAIAQLYSRVSDKALAAAVVEQALQPDLQQPELAASAWATIGHLRLQAQQPALALQALSQAQAASSSSDATALLALELMQSGKAAAEPVVRTYLGQQPSPSIQLAYARVLAEKNRLPEAQEQLSAALKAQPTMAEGWLTQAHLHAQQRQWAPAQQALQRLEGLLQATDDAPSYHQSALLNDAYLLGGRIALQQKDYSQALSWLEKIPDSSDNLNIQSLRALAFAKQGKLALGRALIRAVPAQNTEQQMRKRQAEVALLRDSDAPQEAYLLQRTLYDQQPDRPDIAYETAILAERAGKLQVMEQILQGIIAKHPSYHHALNALGYSYADRGIHLPEAKALIEQALQLAPGDPFITDSLGWVEFRMGNHGRALELLEQAYAQKPDVEIAAHLGEILWELNQPKRARSVWRQALEQEPDNPVLRSTLERLQVSP